MKRRIATDLALMLGGGTVVYEFFVILTQGRIYPFPNFTFFIIGILGTLGILGLGLWGTIKGTTIREKIVSVLLLCVGGGSLVCHVILPIFVMAHGNPICSYYGYEGVAIVFGELIFFSICGLVGLGNFLLDLRKIIKKEA